MQRPDGGRAVLGDCIVPSRAGIQFVEHVDKLQETHPGLVRRKRQTIEVNIFMVKFRSKTDSITLIRSDVDNGELAIKASQSRKLLSLFEPFFDRKAEVPLRSEIEGGNWMNYERDSPVIDEQVQRMEVGQIEIPGVVARGEIRGASIFEIPDIVNRKAVSGATGVSKDRELRLPIGILSWTQRQPPTGDACKTEKDQNSSAQSPESGERDRSDGPHQRSDRAHERGSRQVKVQRPSGPGDEQCRN